MTSREAASDKGKKENVFQIADCKLKKAKQNPFIGMKVKGPDVISVCFFGRGVLKKMIGRI